MPFCNNDNNIIYLGGQLSVINMRVGAASDLFVSQNFRVLEELTITSVYYVKLIPKLRYAIKKIVEKIAQKCSLASGNDSSRHRNSSASATFSRFGVQRLPTVSKTSRTLGR